MSDDYNPETTRISDLVADGTVEMGDRLGVRPPLGAEGPIGFYTVNRAGNRLVADDGNEFDNLHDAGVHAIDRALRLMRRRALRTASFDMWAR